MMSLVEPSSGLRGYPGQFTMPDWWQGWHFTILALLLFSALRVWQTARILRLSPDLEEVEKIGKKPRFFKPRAAKKPTETIASAPKPDARWRVPLATRVLFGDAAMRRELAARWKIRRAAPRVLWAFAIPITFGFYWYGAGADLAGAQSRRARRGFQRHHHGSFAVLDSGQHLDERGDDFARTRDRDVERFAPDIAQRTLDFGR